MLSVGDLVANLNSESKMCGVVVDFELREAKGGGYSISMPVVMWSDKRCSPVMPDMVEVINASR